MSKKKREAVLKAEQNKENLSAEQVDSKEIQNNKEDNDMDLKENVWQKLGEAFIEHGNKKAEYAKEHPTGSKIITGLKVTGTIALGSLAVVAGIAKHNKKKAKDVNDGVEYYDDYDEVDDLENEAMPEDSTYDEEVEEAESETETETEA